MKNIHFIQTETSLAKLQLDRDYGTLTILDKPCIINGQDFVGANLYITSNEEIQIDEWCFEIYNRESTAVAPRFIDENNNTWWLRQINMNVSADDANCKKIILTTDPILIKDDVQALDDEFLNWFIKNQKREIPIITTTVNNESRYTTNIGFESWRKEEPQQVCENCKIEISKYGCACFPQAHPKQETLEEAAHKMLVDYGIKSMGQSIGVLTVKKLMVDMTKWQQEQDKNKFSEEDVKEAFYMGEKHVATEKKVYPQSPDFETWFKQFKNEKYDSNRVVN